MRGPPVQKRRIGSDQSQSWTFTPQVLVGGGAEAHVEAESPLFGAQPRHLGGVHDKGD